jgi:hypothetical protein
MLSVFALLSLALFAERRLEGGLSAFTGRAADAPGSPGEAEARAAPLEHPEVFPLALFALLGMMVFAVCDPGDGVDEGYRAIEVVEAEGALDRLAIRGNRPARVELCKQPFHFRVGQRRRTGCAGAAPAFGETCHADLSSREPP